jgi:hypothetical protein
MDKFKSLVILALFLIAVQPSFADDGLKILGIWKMVSIDLEVQATGDRIPFILGMNPAGYVIYTSEGRMMTIATREGRKPPITTQDRAKLFDSMNAFTGTYRLEGDKCIIKVDVASSPAQAGERVIFIRFDDDRFYATSDWMPGAGGQMGRTIITWERVK